MTSGRARLAAALAGTALLVPMRRWIYWGEEGAFLFHLPAALAAFACVGAVVADARVGVRRRSALATLVLLAGYSLADVGWNLRPSNQVALAVAVAWIETADARLGGAYRFGLWALVPYLAVAKAVLWRTPLDVVAAGAAVGASAVVLARFVLGPDATPGSTTAGPPSRAPRRSPRGSRRPPGVAGPRPSRRRPHRRRGPARR